MIDFSIKPFIFLDGAMGTELQKRGLRPGESPELWNMTRPNAIRQIHKSYLAAGSDILYTNTFGCNAKRLAGSPYSVAEVAAKAVELARSVCRSKGFVALDVGPLGELLYPNGTLRFADAYTQFRTLAVAGEAAGADLAVVETMTDLAEARAAVLAIKENTKLPVFVTMSFEANGRTYFGCPAESFAATFDALGVDAIGVNCSLGPVELLPTVRRIAAVTDKPLIVKANAGLPDPDTGAYGFSPEDFARAMRAYADLGVKFLGGCCGTDPSYIKALRDTFRDLSLWERRAAPAPAVCSAAQYLPLSAPLLVGDQLDPRRCTDTQTALEDGDYEALGDLAAQQAEDGAQLLRLCAPHTEPAEEIRRLSQAVEAVSAACRLPLLIYSENEKALAAALRAASGRCIAAGPRKAALPAAKAYGAMLLLRLEREDGTVPPDAQARLALAQSLTEALLHQGFAKNAILVDCMAQPLAEGGAQSVSAVLETIRLVGEKLGLKTFLDLSAMTSGLPEPGLLQRSFLPLALHAGLDLVLSDPEDNALTDTFAAYRVLAGLDQGCTAYAARFAG